MFFFALCEPRFVLRKRIRKQVSLTKNPQLVGGFNPSEKYESIGMIIPSHGKIIQSCSSHHQEILRANGTHNFMMSRPAVHKHRVTGLLDGGDKEHAHGFTNNDISWSFHLFGYKQQWHPMVNQQFAMGNHHV